MAFAVGCLPDVVEFQTIGGTVAGLDEAAGDMVTLDLINITEGNVPQDEQVIVTINGPFEFYDTLLGGTSYEAVVITPPIGKECNITNATGIVAAATITNIEVVCTPVDLEATVIAIEDEVLENCVETTVLNEGWEEITEVVELNCNGDDINTTAGLEAFQALTYLKITSSNLREIDVSSMPSLKQLWLYLNDLTSLNVTGNTELTHLYVQANCMETSINLDSNVMLEYANLTYNPWDTTAIAYYETLVNPDSFNPGGSIVWDFEYLPAEVFEPCP